MATVPPPPRLQAAAGPRVSFNRDVHIKRFGNRPPPPPADIPKYRRKSYDNDVVDEANLVLSEVEKANQPVKDDTPNKFHSLPIRKKKKSQKPVARSVSDASAKKPLLKKLFSRKSDSNINKVGKIERDPRFEDGGARRLIRSKSDASSNRNIKDKVMKKRSEAIGNSVNQLSPIIENALKEDYFEEVANKESRWKSDDNLEEYPSDYFVKNSVERMHSSQLPAERPALTKGMKVDNIVKRLSMEKISPPPSTLGPTFSYIYPNANGSDLSNSFLDKKYDSDSNNRSHSFIDRSPERKHLDYENNNYRPSDFHEKSPKYDSDNNKYRSSERLEMSPKSRFDSENNNHRPYYDRNGENARSSVSPWRRITPPNDEMDSSSKSYSPPKNILKEQNYDDRGRHFISERKTVDDRSRNGSKHSISERKHFENYDDRDRNGNRHSISERKHVENYDDRDRNGSRHSVAERKNAEQNGSKSQLNNLSERRRNLENRIYSRGMSVEREKSCPPTFHYKQRTAEIEKKYSPERTHLDIIQTPSFKSTTLVKSKDHDPHSHHRSTNSLRKVRKSEDTTDHKNSLRRERKTDQNGHRIDSLSTQKLKRACETFLRQERKYAEELSVEKKFRNSYRERSIDDGSLFDPRIDKYPVSTLSLNRKRDTLSKSESKESSPSSLKTKSILKRTIFGSNHSDKSKKASKLEVPPQPAPRVIDYSTRRRLSTPKASPVLVRTMSEKKTHERQKSPNSWFKSLTRTKSKSSDKQLKPATSLTFFGESDLDSIISPAGSTMSRHRTSNRNDRVSRSTQHLNGYSRTSADEVDFGKRSRNYDSGSDELENTYKRRSRSLSKDQVDRRRQYFEQGPPKPPRVRSNSRRRYMNSSEDDQSLNSQQSVVYLHAKTVGDIPQPYKYSSPRSDISKSIKTDGTVPMQRTVIKSLSLNAPWTPKKISDGYEIDYSADQDRRMKKHQI